MNRDYGQEGRQEYLASQAPCQTELRLSVGLAVFVVGLGAWVLQMLDQVMFGG